MIGDAKAAGKRHSTRAHGPEFKKKLSQGRAYKHVTGAEGADSGGGAEKHRTAKRMVKGHPNGVGVADRQAPHKQKERKEVKHVDQGKILDEWCRGRRGCYK